MTYNVVCMYAHAHAYVCMYMCVRGEETNKLIKMWSISVKGIMEANTTVWRLGSSGSHESVII